MDKVQGGYHQDGKILVADNSNSNNSSSCRPTIVVVDNSVHDDRKSEVSGTAVHGGTTTHKTDGSMILITGTSQNESNLLVKGLSSLNVARAEGTKNGYQGGGGACYIESKSVQDNRQSTVANVVVNDGNPSIVYHNPHIYVTQPGQDTFKPLKDENEHLKQLLSSLNEDTWAESEDEITRSFKAEKLNEPSFKVYPQMEECPAFYKGGFPEHDDEEYSDNNSNPFLMMMDDNECKTKEPEYRKTNIFNPWFRQKPNLVSYESLKNMILVESEVESAKLGIIGLFAPAGAGKSTCLRRLARDTMLTCGISPKTKYGCSTENSRFYLVLFIDLKDIRSENVTTLEEILLKGYFDDINDMKLVYGWLQENQSKVALFIDGLDQAAWSVEESEQTKLRKHEEATVSLIMYNLLVRNLLPGVRIAIASREFKATTLPTLARPEKIITLTGFTDTDAEKLFKGLVSSKHGEHPWEKLTSQSSSLARFLFTPLFLMFAAAVSCYTEIPLPRNMSGLVAQMLELFEDSDNIQEAKRIWEILRKLKCLAHEGMEKNVVIFTVADLKKHGLSVSDVRDMLLTVQKSRALSQRVSATHLNISFCHQCFQEFLSAMFIAEMSLPQFKIFVDNHLHQDRWSVVRQFLFGILYTLHGTHFQFSDRAEKQRTLSDSLPHQMTSTKHYQRLELYAALNESDDSVLIRSHLQRVQLRAITLGHGGAHLVSSMMARCHALEEVTLMACRLDDHLVGIMTKNLKPKRVKVKYLDITWSMSALPFPSLNLLLKYLIVDSLRVISSDVSGQGGLDWTKVKRLLVDDLLYFINEESIITLKQLRGKICGNLTGCYNKSDKTLHFNFAEACHITNIAFDSLHVVAKFFDPSAVYVTFQGKREKQYLKYTNLEKMRNWVINAEVGKVVLDCDVHHELESTLIVAYVTQAHAGAVDIKVRNGNNSAIPDHEGLQRELSALGCLSNIQLRNKVIAPGWKSVGRIHVLGSRVRDGEKPSIKDMLPSSSRK